VVTSPLSEFAFGFVPREKGKCESPVLTPSSMLGTTSVLESYLEEKNRPPVFYLDDEKKYFVEILLINIQASVGKAQEGFWMSGPNVWKGCEGDGG